MTYKKSNYNVEIETLSDGRKLMYNTYTGIFGVMDKKTQAIFDDIENISTSSDDEAMKTIDVMARAGYIINANKDELAAIKIGRAKGRHYEENLGLTIAPTMDCNMCCPYCYENKNKLVMSNETQEQLVAFVKAHLDTYTAIKKMSVTWYGGEPLMQKDTIYNLSEKIISLCKEKGVEYTASIITNGVLLDAETAKRLAKDCKVGHTQITIDGLKELHNKRRLLVDGSDSFDIITRNIDACKEFLRISVRVNLDKDNISDIDGLTKYFIEEKGWTESPTFYVAPVGDFETNCLNDSSRCLQGEEFAEIDIKCVRALYEVNRDVVAHQFFPRRRPIFCGGEGMLNYIIGPDGDIYNCYVHIGVKERSTGHISKPFLITSEYGKWLNSDIHSKCEPCQFLPMCMGGCGIHRIVGDGTPQCFRTFYTYKDTLKLAYEDYVIQQHAKQKTAAHTTQESGAQKVHVTAAQEVAATEVNT
jgi:uncharacterized protein